MRITKYNIDRFINGSEMDCSGKGITYIEYIPDNITHIFCYDNQLTQLPKLPESLKTLYCENNKLHSLPKLTDSLKDLHCENNNLPYEITIDNVKEHNTLLKRKEILKRICV